MKNKSIYNMIITIIQSVVSIVLMVLAVIFLSIKNDSIGIILMSITFPIIISYSILKTIFYGLEQETPKSILDIICFALSQIITVLISTYIVLKLNNSLSWIAFSVVIVISIITIFFKIFDISEDTSYILSTINTFLLIIVTCYIYSFNLITSLFLLSISLSHISMIGNRINNKLLMSINLLSILLFGLFLILV